MPNSLFERCEIAPQKLGTKRPGRRRPNGSGADPMVQFTLPAPLIAQIERWAKENGKTRPEAFRELIVAGFRPIEPIECEIQLRKHKPHAPHMAQSVKSPRLID
jgi:hypothetical protein